ncbi:unnamed protein product [Rotaria sordida]|uniref:Uncharacterized protein n=1 Tax=Rotaria sordida TaxID=392033 RepID=A0A814ZRS2_9BILA|nr:unnamed protein product [Rotaria sordida]
MKTQSLSLKSSGVARITLISDDKRRCNAGPEKNVEGYLVSTVVCSASCRSYSRDTILSITGGAPSLS